MAILRSGNNVFLKNAQLPLTPQIRPKKKITVPFCIVARFLFNFILFLFLYCTVRNALLSAFYLIFNALLPDLKKNNN